MLVVDAASTREESERSIALKRILNDGVNVTTVESLIFELLRTFKDAEFKAMLEIAKDRVENEMPDF